VLAVGVRQSMQAAYYRGIASDAQSRIVVQESVIDSVTESSVHLAEELQQAAYLAEQQRLTTEREVIRLGLERIEARERSEALTERLRADLDSVQALDLDSIVISYDIQIAALDSIVVAERKYRMAESLRADAASELVLSLRSLVSEHEAMDLIQTLEVTSLRAAMKPSLGLRLKADWWIGAVGVAAGYLIWGTK